MAESSLKERKKKEMPVSPGRPKGVPNKNTKLIKDMITEALDNAGGVAYLQKQATLNPKAFLMLVGKLLPMQVEGSGKNGELVVSVIERKIVDPQA